MGEQALAFPYHSKSWLTLAALSSRSTGRIKSMRHSTLSSHQKSVMHKLYTLEKIILTLGIKNIETKSVSIQHSTTSSKNIIFLGFVGRIKFTRTQFVQN